MRRGSGARYWEATHWEAASWTRGCGIRVFGSLRVHLSVVCVCVCWCAVALCALSCSCSWGLRGIAVHGQVVRVRRGSLVRILCSLPCQPACHYQ